MHELRFGNSLVKLGTLEKVYGFPQDWLGKILESRVIHVGKGSGFEKVIQE